MGDRRYASLTRRGFLKAAGVGALAMALPCPELLAAEARKPNVVVIVSDDHGYGAMTCAGNWDIPTPNIDAIAAGGVRFTNGYVTCPVCSPTRAGIMTGRYQQRFGHEDNEGPPKVAQPDTGLPLDEKTLANYMKEQGYATAAIGKWHLGNLPKYNPLKRGFDEFFGFVRGAHSYTDPEMNTPNPILRGYHKVDEKEYLTDAFAREAVSFIDRNKRKPFFLYLTFNAVHAAHVDMPPSYKDSLKEITHAERRVWAGQLRNMDDAVGRVMAKLRESGIEEDTLVFFLGDNGGYPLGGISPNAPLSGRKADTYEGGIRIPFMMQWKGKIPAGKVYDKQVVSLDILPTAVGAAGGKPAANVEGVDLLPYVTGRNDAVPHDKLFWRWIEKHGARVGNWKLVQNGDGKEMLFNLKDDIGEKNDLSAANPEKLKELQAAYKEWDSKNVPPKWLDGRRKAAAKASP